jgi:hypothetical protein
LSPSAAANRRFGFQIKPEITPPPIPTNPGTAPDERALLDEFGDRLVAYMGAHGAMRIVSVERI